MNAILPYGWSPKGQRVEIFLQRDKKVNQFRIFRPDNFGVTYESPGNINSQFLIASINNFIRYVDKPTDLVLDNAPTHGSGLFQVQLEKWMENNRMRTLLLRVALRRL
jgi:hypothetical protein